MFVTFTTLKEKVLDKIGALSSLLTTSKASLVEAINELFTSVSNGKAAVASAITAKGVTTSPDATFTQMATNIGQIQTGGGASDHYDKFTLSADVAATDTVVYTLAGDALSHKDDTTFALMIHAISPPTSGIAVIGGCVANEKLGEKTDGTVHAYGYTIWASDSTGKVSAVNITHPLNNQSGTFTADFWVAADGKVHIKGASSYKWKAGTYIIVMGW